jgi:methionyl-tRNA synthetase
VDFSISRLKEKMPWGVPVPDDETQVMYVWFDALVNYISALGWPEDAVRFEKFWGTVERPNGVQIAGKDNLRQQSAMWQAMLLSAGLAHSKQIIIHGFINSGGQKMSKSLGNVIDPFAVVEKYGVDALRYWLAREMNTFEDGDFTWEKFVESYNGNLANGLGNLTSRVLKMAVNAGVARHELGVTGFDSEFMEHLDSYEIQKAADWVWQKIKAADEFIAKEEPFKKVKTDEAAGKKDIAYLLGLLEHVAYHLQPLLPGSAEKILTALQNISVENIPRLFPRVD